MNSFIKIPPKGLLQGCPTSPTLFKIFLEHALREWRRKCEGMGVPVRNHHIYSLNFADDQVIIAQDVDDLSYMVRKLKEEYDRAGLEINFAKTEYLDTTEDATQDLEIDEDTVIKGCDKFKYLGFLITKKGTTEDEIASRLGQTRAAIRQLNPILWSKRITNKNKTRICDTIIRSIMTYGAECWVMNQKVQNKITATEMEYLRRSCRLSRLDKVPNVEIRRRIGNEKNLLEYIEEKRLLWYGHVRRSDETRWINRVTNWSPIGRRKRGRPRKTWRDEVDQAMEKRGLQDGEWEDRNLWRIGSVEGRRCQP